MVIFNSYVKFPEGTWDQHHPGDPLGSKGLAEVQDNPVHRELGTFLRHDLQQQKDGSENCVDIDVIDLKIMYMSIYIYIYNNVYVCIYI